MPRRTSYKKQPLNTLLIGSFLVVVVLALPLAIRESMKSQDNRSDASSGRTVVSPRPLSSASPSPSPLLGLPPAPASPSPSPIVVPPLPPLPIVIPPLPPFPPAESPSPSPVVPNPLAITSQTLSGSAANFKGMVEGTTTNSTGTLTMRATGLPSGIKITSCIQGPAKTGRYIRCSLAGKAAAGTYTMTAHISDGKSSLAKNIKLILTEFASESQ